MKRFNKKLIIPVLIFFIAIFTAIIIIYNHDFSAVEENPFSKSKINILITGSDTPVEGPARADTIILASIDLETANTGILSIPRDTKMRIPGYGLNKINASYAFGGIELVQETLEIFLEVPIDYYIGVDFEGFASIIDTLGGIELVVDDHLHYIDEAGDLHIDIPAGKQVLDGENALDYVRYRDPLFADLGRINRQQKFLKSTLQRIMKPDILFKLPALYGDIRQTVETNIPFQDITPFVKLLNGMELNQMQSETLPGEAQYINDINYWLVDHEKMGIVINSLIHSKEYIENSNYKVTILNGNGVSGTAGHLARKLNNYGFVIERIGNADHFDYKQTVIEYYNPRDKQVVASIRELLGGKAIKSEEEGQDIKIILGLDYFENK